MFLSPNADGSSSLSFRFTGNLTNRYMGFGAIKTAYPDYSYFTPRSTSAEIFKMTTNNSCLPLPTYNTTTIGEFMYGGINACVNATYTANSTAKLGGTSAKNKGYVTLSAPYTFPSVYQNGNYVHPLHMGTLMLIKY